jgi:hypothetical protein
MLATDRSAGFISIQNDRLVVRRFWLLEGNSKLRGRTDIVHSEPAGDGLIMVDKERIDPMSRWVSIEEPAFRQQSKYADADNIC